MNKENNSPRSFESDFGSVTADADATQTPTEPKPTATYADAYATLHDIAEKLRHAGPDDLDTLIQDYRHAMAAYRICADRIALIRQELDIEP